jgi:hypothetical protein
MEYKYSTYKEFNSRNEAVEAVRVLVSDGFSDIQTEDLYALQTSVDVGAPPRRKSFYFESMGVLIGGVGGVLLGLLVFGVPHATLGFPESYWLVVAGVIVCMVASAVVGLIEGFILAKRHVHEPVSGTRRGVVGVRVKTESPEKLIRAKSLLAQFGERPNRRLRDWFLGPSPSR